MASGFQSPITIKTAIDKIFAREYLLPAIQRKFVWKSTQIEVLFDSIMRGYPINSFMFWEIKDDKIKTDFKFYEFLTDYREYYKDDNPYIDTLGNKFCAIIDGQQRLTSLYIGLKGTYAYHMPRKRWDDNEESLPTRKLYLNILSPKVDEDSSMEYDFRFLTDAESEKEDEKTKWFLVGEILNYEDEDKFSDYKHDKPIFNNKFARNTIDKLRKRIFDAPLINYYLEESQEIDKVLDIFIRTNSGGEPLSFSDLLMSYTTANWTEKDARKKFEDLIKQVNTIGKPNFRINNDLILKTYLVLFKENIKFEVKNFDKDSVSEFEQNWDGISKAIVEAFKLIESWGFNESNFKAKNAIIPIVYFIYHNKLQNDINKEIRCKDERPKIRQWLCMALLKRVFGGQSDSVLRKIARVQEKHKDDEKFPLDEIKEAFKEDPNKNLEFSEEFIDGLLETQLENPNCDIILALLYSDINFDRELHKDHLHPRSYFEKLQKGNMNEDDYEFYNEKKNYNSVLNLQLLGGSANESKSDKPLKEWVEENKIDKASYLIPTDVSLDIKDFKEFITKRRELLKKKLYKIVGKEQ